MFAAQTVQDIYKAGHLRDPFVSLSGSGGGVALWQPDAGETPPDISTLVLKGILQGKKERWALVADEATGSSFVVNAQGRLTNQKGKEVPGIAAVIQAKSVILMTQNKMVREIKLSQEESE